MAAPALRSLRSLADLLRRTRNRCEATGALLVELTCQTAPRLLIAPLRLNAIFHIARRPSARARDEAKNLHFLRNHKTQLTQAVEQLAPDRPELRDNVEAGADRQRKDVVDEIPKAD